MHILNSCSLTLVNIYVPSTCLLVRMIKLKVRTKGTEGTLDVIMISYINLVAGLLHYFSLDHAYK